MNVLRTLSATAAGLALALTPAVAHATPPGVTPGAPCSTPGAVGQKHGVKYICQQKKSDDCPRWHSAPKPGPHGTPWSHGPCPCTPSPSTSATPSASPSATPSTPPTTAPPTSPPVQASSTPPASPTDDTQNPTAAGTAGMLPVTGTDWSVVLIAGGSGLLAVVIGFALIYFSRRRAA